jgi:hypothetical protein
VQTLQFWFFQKMQEPEITHEGYTLFFLSHVPQTRVYILDIYFFTFYLHI